MPLPSDYRLGYPFGYPVTDLYRFVIALIPRFGTAQALADALDMSLSAFLRGAKHGTLGIENCLRLAQLAGEHPSKVLALAGKKDVATLIESLYGPAAATTLSDTDHRLLGLPDGVKRRLLQLVADIEAGESQRKHSADGGERIRA